MNNKKVKYIGFFDISEYGYENRNYFLAATNKMLGVSKNINSLDIDVEIISPSWSKNNRGFYRGRNVKISDGIELICGPTIGAENKLLKILRIGISLIWLFGFLLKNCKKNENIIVYHSIILILPIILAKKIKKFNLILEVEEIYQNAKVLSKINCKREYKIFKSADKYIFPTELLNKKINIENKPNIIIYGDYRVVEKIDEKFDDGLIHIVYAGTFDETKGGASKAIEIAEYLDEKYHIHILGFGSSVEIEEVKRKILKIQKNTRCHITYEGLLQGQDYIKFLQKCHIGLSTQDASKNFNETSFPSKILSYLSNNLRVVTVNIRVIKASKIEKLLYFYDKNTGDNIAKTIKKIDVSSKYNSQNFIKELNREIKFELKKIIELGEN